MNDLSEAIAQATGMEIQPLLKAVVRRYSELFPDWEIHTLSLQKSADRNEQIDKVITMLQQMKD